MSKIVAEFKEWLEKENSRIRDERYRIQELRNRAMFPLAGDRAPLPETKQASLEEFDKWLDARVGSDGIK